MANKTNYILDGYRTKHNTTILKHNNIAGTSLYLLLIIPLSGQTVSTLYLTNMTK